MLLIITTYGQFEPVSWRPFFARDRASEKSILSLWPETWLKPLNHLQAVPRYYHAPCCFRGCGITIAVHKKFILQFLDDLSTSKLFDLAESPSKACLMNIFLSIKTLAHSKLKNIKFCILENLTFYNVPQMSLHPILKVYLI